MCAHTSSVSQTLVRNSWSICLECRPDLRSAPQKLEMWLVAETEVHATESPTLVRMKLLKPFKLEEWKFNTG